MGYGQLRRSPGSATSLRVLVYFAQDPIAVHQEWGAAFIQTQARAHRGRLEIEAQITAGGRTFSLSGSSHPVQEADSTWSAPGAMGADANGLTP